METDSVWDRLEASVAAVPELAERKEEMAEPDLRLSAALALNGWRPSNALDRAVEYWEFDMEHGLQPQHIGTKWNLKASPQF